MKTVPPHLLPSKRIFSSLLFFFAAASAAAQTQPRVVLERVVDGRGNRVCEIAKAKAEADGTVRSAWVFRGLLRDDLVLTLEAVGNGPRVHAVSLGAGAPMKFETSGAGGRVTASSPVSTFKYFEHDLLRKTVRCNLSRLADETDPGLLRAAAEWLEQGLEDDGISSEELPLLALSGVEKRPPRAVLPDRKTVPWTDGGEEAEALAAAARAAVAR